VERAPFGHVAGHAFVAPGDVTHPGRQLRGRAGHRPGIEVRVATQDRGAQTQQFQSRPTPNRQELNRQAPDHRIPDWRELGRPAPTDQWLFMADSFR
jgi:hypothetical protein